VATEKAPSNQQAPNIGDGRTKVNIARGLADSRPRVVGIRLLAGEFEENESLTEKEACLPARKHERKGGKFHRFSGVAQASDFTGNKKYLLTISAS
jgi:hypothetical protein